MYSYVDSCIRRLHALYNNHPSKQRSGTSFKLLSFLQNIFRLRVTFFFLEGPTSLSYCIARGKVISPSSIVNSVDIFLFPFSLYFFHLLLVLFVEWRTRKKRESDSSPIKRYTIYCNLSFPAGPETSRRVLFGLRIKTSTGASWGV